MASERFRWQYLALDTEVVHYLFDRHGRTDFAVYCYPALPKEGRFVVCRWAPAGWAPATARDAKGHATEGRAKGRAIRLYLASLKTPTPAGP